MPILSTVDGSLSFLKLIPGKKSLFISADGSGNRISYSTDGNIWNSISGAGSISNTRQYIVRDFAYIFPYNGGDFNYTKDGINWYTTVNSGNIIGHRVGSIAAFENFYMAFNGVTSQSSNLLYSTSTDGFTWIQTSYNFNILGNSISFGPAIATSNAIFVMVVGSSLIRMAKTVDGQTWLAPTLSSTISAKNWGFARNLNNKLIFVESTSDSSSSILVSEDDGISWTLRSLPTKPLNTSPTSIIFTGSKYIIAYSGTSTYFYSTDLISWSSATFPFTLASTYVKLAQGKNITVAFSSNSSLQDVHYSIDHAQSWTAASQKPEPTNLIGFIG